MKTLVHRLSVNPKYAKVVYWGKLVSITGVTQLLVQATGFVTGILIIRLLPIQEFALYTLANTMLGTMTILADSGIANGVMAEAGKVWQDKNKLGNVLTTGLNLRRIFGIVSLFISIPILALLLFQHGATATTTILIILALIPAFFAALSDSILEIVPKLHQDIKGLQKNQAEVSIGRLALSAGLIFLFPFTFIALIASSVPRIYGNWKLRRISSRFATRMDSSDPIVQTNIIKGVKRTLPIVIYYCLSGQISIWLISIFGSTTSIAQIGALGRLAMIFNLLTILFSTLVIPRFARMKRSRNVLLRTFLFLQAGIFLISILLLLAVWIFSDQILWVFGPNYYGLNFELFLVAIANCIGLMIAVSSQLVLSRGWFLNPYLLIGVNLISTLFSIVFFNLTSLIGILYFNIMVTLTHLLLMFAYGFYKINRETETAD